MLPQMNSLVGRILLNECDSSSMPLVARLRWEGLDLQVSPTEVFASLAGQPYPVVFESSATHPRWSRYTILTCRPREIITLKDGQLRNRTGEQIPGKTVLSSLRHALGAVQLDNEQAGKRSPFPYGPGWFGYIGYEFGRYIERLPGKARRDTTLPDLHLAFYDAVAVYDVIEQRWYLSWLEDDSQGGISGSETADVLRQVVLSAESLRRQDDFFCRDDYPFEGLVDSLEITSNFTREEYLRAVARCIDYIVAGDIFQVNLSQRFTVVDAPSPWAIFHALRRRNPAWYSAFLELDDSAVISSSPELFLRVRGANVLTRPIKGTCKRTGNLQEDKQSAARLLASPKDNAELAMIIDLLRNDLGRVCRFGSIGVLERRRLEEHPSVYHLVGTVVGELREDVDVVDLLSATFPGGSITGAPKIRAMEIIDELEPVARGVYTGSIGYIGLNGNCELNIVIRTIVWDGGVAHVQVGGGIVADSTPEGEYAETLDKVRAPLEAIALAKRFNASPVRSKE